MPRPPALFWILIAWPTAAMAQQAQEPKQDVVPVHGHPLPLSCSEWKRNPDGSWTNVSPLLVGKETVKEVTLRGAKETGTLEAKCLNGAVAAPQPGRNQTRPAGAHKHNAPAPANGT